MANVRILYCPVCNGYDTRSASLVAELNGTGYIAEIQEGEKSQFDVLVDGNLAFSKQREGRFPELAEVLALLP